jgi:predicted DNA-binding protein (MmcQ/YjbR family)
VEKYHLIKRANPPPSLRKIVEWCKTVSYIGAESEEPILKTVRELAQFCMTFRGASGDYPFGPEPLVMKAGGKMFALIGETDGIPSLSLKCEPLMAELLRQAHPAVKPGYHLNKKHWNTVTIDGSVPEAELADMIKNSYDLVVRGLAKAARESL